MVEHKQYPKFRNIGANIENEVAYQDAAVKDGALSNGLFACYIFSACHTILCLYHQYKLDSNSVRLDYLSLMRELDEEPRFHLSSARPTNLITDELLQGLNATTQHENGWLDLLGSPLRHMKFCGAGFHLGHFLMTLVAYVCTQIIFRYLIPFDQNISRILIDYERELKLCVILVEEQMNEFLMPHRNSTKTVVMSQFDFLDKQKQIRAIADLRAHIRKGQVH